MSFRLQSINLSTGKGIPLSLRVWIPPNLAVTAPKDRIAVRIEFCLEKESVPPEKLDRGRAYIMEAPHILATALLESWCGGRVYSMLELSRDRLRQLLAPLEGEPVCFFFGRQGQPIPWESGRLLGVHEHLEAPKAIPMEAEKASPPPRLESPVEEEGLTRMEVDGSLLYLVISLPSRDSVLYQDALDLVKRWGFNLEPSNRRWWLRDRHQVLSFLAQHWRELEERYRANVSPRLAAKMKEVQWAGIQTEVRESNGGYEVGLRLNVDGVPEVELQTALDKNSPYLEVKGRLVLLEKKTLEQLRTAQKQLSGRADQPLVPAMKRRLPATEVPAADLWMEELSLPRETPETWKERGQALRRLDALRLPPLSPALQATLRSYQKMGVAWLWHLYRNQLGGVLADEMGLGKTIQALALLRAVHLESKDSGPCLVVCPASLVENWRREARRFVPEMKVFLHHRNQRLESAEAAGEWDLIIVSYGTLARDHVFFRKVNWNCVVADEAQHIKNRETLNAKALKGLPSRGRFLLTGTPVENSLDDLFSLFEFLMPGYLEKPPPSAGREEKVWMQSRLQKRAAPYILRRTKNQVAADLPEKLEQTVFCELDERQEALYRKVQVEAERDLSDQAAAKASEGKLRMLALKQLLRLRQICVDPRLVDESAEAGHSAKLKVFHEILEEAMDGGHRMLVFSQFVRLLTLLRQDLEEKGIPYCYLDGSTVNRQREVDRFQEDSGIPVFLISLKAGGTGLNLTGADTVVHFDPWWNPAVEAQATDRAHRIGQTRRVTSIKLIASGTVEEKVLALQQSKRRLLEDLWEESDLHTSKIGLADLQELLKSDS